MLLLWWVGCEAKSVQVDSGGTDTGETEDTASAAFRPYVESLNYADCDADVDGVDTWFVSIFASDPQGPDDLASLGSTVTILEGKDELAVYDMACSSGECFGSWQADQDGVFCSVGKASIFRFVVVDLVGNQSEPWDYDPS